MIVINFTKNCQRPHVQNNIKIYKIQNNTIETNFRQHNRNNGSETTTKRPTNKQINKTLVELADKFPVPNKNIIVKEFGSAFMDLLTK